MKNIDIQIVNYLVSQFNTPISELCLDVFLELQDSFEPQFLWFQAVVYADIKTENGADAISIILASFLEADEIFWGVLIESFDMICEKLSRFDRSKLVMEFLEDCQVGICQRDEF
ncbi:hypothetical protein SS50377_22402 [Spironucleus salmonicida]|nr:hypothetical protein SS50377_22402 [Spironucleus salmonicida]